MRCGGTLTGQAIDSHNVVVRMNIAPTTGKETYVGRKTTMRLINSKWARLYSQGSSMVGVGHKTHLIVRVVDNTYYFNSLYRSMAKSRPDTLVLLLNANNVKGAQKLLEAYRLCYLYSGRQFVGGTIPSSGLVLTLALTQMCNTVNLYGFGRPRYRGRLVPYQYYVEKNSDGSLNQGSQNHAFSIEMIVLKELARTHSKVNMCGINEASMPECRVPLG
ncbi:hypothetical protein CYMTET_47583 [Cymbomonas tetramitiformis]|uniref:Uncharacterized protein n=1 Tax=Cymbomonas tetramitiformis TaxID=36881 RepID=A0AAE0BVF9_9CHLO|nr:hypothetical protein CYMTET_47583 [Cymbomonas tetramitiformis]